MPKAALRTSLVGNVFAACMSDFTRTAWLTMDTFSLAPPLAMFLNTLQASPTCFSSEKLFMT